MSEGTVGQIARADAQVSAAPPPPVQQQAAVQARPRPEPKPQQAAEQRQPAKAETRVKEQLSLDELADMLRKLNLTFDLFEIETEFSVDMDDNQVRVVVRNTRTNEVIRRIPAHEFEAQFTSFRDGVGLLIDSFL